MKKKLTAEFIGTFILVFGGCGSAVFAAGLPNVGIGYLGVSIAFGLTVLGCAYAFGSVSGCHLNPAVSIGLWQGGRFEAKELGGYIGAQIAGGLAGAAGLLLILKNATAGYDLTAAGNTLAANGFGEHSPNGYNMIAGLASEFILTFIFLMVILGSTWKKSPEGFAGIPIGLTLTLVHLVGIPITNLSVNPARSLGPAVVLAASGGATWPIMQIWLFIAAPIAGAVVAGIVSKMVFNDDDD